MGYRVIVIDAYLYEKSVIIEERYFYNRVEAVSFANMKLAENRIAVLFKIGG